MPNDFVKFIQDELSGYYKFTYKKMFGEHCLFYGDKIIAIITDDDEIFVKVDEETRHEFVQAGGHPYTYVAQGKQRVMHYMSVPSEVTDDRDELVYWFGLGVKALKSTDKSPKCDDKCSL